MKKVIVWCLCILGISGIVYCGEIKKIELTDGSVIEAEIISFDKGTYTLHTGSLGKIMLPASKIIKIGASPVNASATTNSSGQSNSVVKSEMDRLKTEITGNPEIMKVVANLLVDPQFQEVLKDPEIVNAINSGNIRDLTANDKFMSVTNNPKIQDIKTKLEE